MARPLADITGTQAEAQRRGVSRRTIQRERRRLAEKAEAAVVQSQPVQLTLESVEPSKLPDFDEVRVDPIESANGLGWAERAARYRLREALKAGDAAAVKLFASALSDVWKVLVRVEPLAELRVAQLPNRLKKRLDILNDFDDLLATHGPAWIRAHQPSPTEENQHAIAPPTEEELVRWNDHADKVNAATEAEQTRQPGPCERELLGLS